MLVAGWAHRRFHAANALRVISVTAVLVLMSGCGEKKPCVDKSKPALETCQADLDKSRKDLNDLKLKLAEALANPGKIEVDPSVLQIEGETGKHGGGRIRSAREGTLTQAQVIQVLRRSKASLQACYNRALKRNSNLHHGAITLTVGFKVLPSGQPTEISLRPNRDAQMNRCMVKAIRRWSFPPFKGQAVGIESPVTLMPKG